MATRRVTIDFGELIALKFVIVKMELNVILLQDFANAHLDGWMLIVEHRAVQTRTEIIILKNALVEITLCAII